MKHARTKPRRLPKISIQPHVEIFIPICAVGYAAEWRLLIVQEKGEKTPFDPKQTAPKGEEYDGFFIGCFL